MKLDLSALRQVVTLADLRSYRRAALALHISQPALSRSITALESTLGVRLFDRSRAAVLPTPFGALLVERGRSLIGELGALSKEIESLRGLESGELRIGAGLYPAEISVGTAVGRLSARYPGIRVSLQAVQWREVIALVTAGEVDVAVVELSPFQDESRMALEPLPRHPVAFVCRPGHPLLGERRPSITRILAFPLVGARLPRRFGENAGPPTPTLKNDPLSGDLIPPLHIESIALAKRIVAVCDAVALLPVQSIASEAAAGTLAMVDCQPAWLTTNYGFVYLKGRTLSPAALAFMAEVRAAEAELVVSAG